MNVLPYERFRVTLPLPENDVYIKLGDNCVPHRSILHALRKSTTKLVGIVSRERFKLVRPIRYSNGFLPNAIMWPMRGNPPDIFGGVLLAEVCLVVIFCLG